MESILNRSQKIIETKKEKARKLSIWEAGAFSVSDGFGLRNIAPYALALNASNPMIGFLTSIPSLLGNISQLFTNKLLGRYSRKRLVINAVFLQSIFWLLLLIPGIIFLKQQGTTNNPVIILIALYTGLIISGALAGPAWMSWMKDLIPERELGRYFAKRNKIAGIVAFICMILAGFILDYFKKIEVLYGFFILIFLSFIFRSISSYIFTKKYEPPFKKTKKVYFSFGQFLTNMPFNNFGRFVVFISLMNFAVAIGSPFFAVYLLKQRELSYIIYMSLIMIMPLATILTMTYWGKVSDSIGNVKIMKITGLGIALLPLLYLVSNYLNEFIILFIFLIVIEVFAGVNWGGFNLAVANFIFRSVSREKMILCSSYMNLLSGISIFFGATLGGYIAVIPFWNPILLVFIVSGLGRLLVYLIVLPKIKEKAHEKVEYDKKDIIANLSFAPRFFNPMHGVNYAIKATKGLSSLGKIKLF